MFLDLSNSLKYTDLALVFIIYMPTFITDCQNPSALANMCLGQRSREQRISDIIEKRLGRLGIRYEHAWKQEGQRSFLVHADCKMNHVPRSCICMHSITLHYNPGECTYNRYSHRAPAVRLGQMNNKCVSTYLSRYTSRSMLCQLGRIGRLHKLSTSYIVNTYPTPLLPT